MKFRWPKALTHTNVNQEQREGTRTSHALTSNAWKLG